MESCSASSSPSSLPRHRDEPADRRWSSSLSAAQRRGCQRVWSLTRDNVETLRDLSSCLVELFPALDDAGAVWALVVIVRRRGHDVVVPAELHGRSGDGDDDSVAVVVVDTERVFWPKALEPISDCSHVTAAHAERAAEHVVQLLDDDPVAWLGVSYVGPSTVRVRRSPMDAVVSGHCVWVHVKAYGWRPYGSRKLPESVTVDGVVVPVEIAEGRFELAATGTELRGYHAVLKMGVAVQSSSSARTGYGALGMVAKRGETVGLITASHVVRDPTGTAADVRQPPATDRPAGQGPRVISTILNWTRPNETVDDDPLTTASYIFPEAGGTGVGDIAFLPFGDQSMMHDQHFGCAQESLYEDHYGDDFGGTFPAVCLCKNVGEMLEGQVVYKVGPATGLSHGTVEGHGRVNWFLEDTAISLAGFTELPLQDYLEKHRRSFYGIVKAFMVRPPADHPYSFCLHGDSGAIAFEMEAPGTPGEQSCRAAPVGIVIGMESSSSQQPSGIVCSLRPLFQALNVRALIPHDCSHVS